MSNSKTNPDEESLKEALKTLAGWAEDMKNRAIVAEVMEEDDPYSRPYYKRPLDYIPPVRKSLLFFPDDDKNT